MSTTMRVAIVTGGSRGIGKAIGRGLAEDGYRVALVARTPDRLEATAAELAASFGQDRILPIVADITDAAALAGAVDRVVAAWGRIDAVVNNAGSARTGGLEDLTAEAWAAGFAGKLFGGMELVRLALPHIAGPAVIVNIAGSAAQRPQPASILVGAINAAVVHATGSLAAALTGRRIRVVVVSPGQVQTDRFNDMTATRAEQSGRPVEEIRAEAAAKVPIGRIGQPDDIAAAVRFLVSDAASFITGAHVVVDGGGSLGVTPA